MLNVTFNEVVVCEFCSSRNMNIYNLIFGKDKNPMNAYLYSEVCDRKRERGDILKMDRIGEVNNYKTDVITPSSRILIARKKD